MCAATPKDTTFYLKVGLVLGSIYYLCIQKVKTNIFVILIYYKIKDRIKENTGHKKGVKGLSIHYSVDNVL